MSTESHLLVAYDSISRPGSMSNNIKSVQADSTLFSTDTSNKTILKNRDTNIPEQNGIKYDIIHSKQSQTNNNGKTSPLSPKLETSAELLITSGSTLVASKEINNKSDNFTSSETENLTDLKLRSEYGLILPTTRKESDNEYDDCGMLEMCQDHFNSLNENSHHLFVPAYNNENNSNYNNKQDMNSSLAVNNSIQYEYDAEFIPPTSMQPIIQQPVGNYSRNQLSSATSISDISNMTVSQQRHIMAVAEDKKRRDHMARSQSVTNLNQTNWKSAMINSWYYFKYAIPTKSKTEFTDKPIWLLGKHYIQNNPIKKDALCQVKNKLRNENIGNSIPKHLNDFINDFQTRYWISYRKNFHPLDGTSLTSDCGWGCMIRSGQMLLANALLIHKLGRDWRINNATSSQFRLHHHIISYFLDYPGSNHSFSLHNLTRIGQICGRKVGDWYGPSQVSFVLRDAVYEAKHYHHNFDNIHVYIARDCTLYRNEIEGLFENNGNSNVEISPAVIILIPVRLGSDHFNMEYSHCVKQFLSMEFTLGIIGGKPKHSLYFIGFQGDSLLCMDPHVCQASVKNLDEEFTTYHSPVPKKLLTHKMDPSCTMGFMCRSLNEFTNFCSQANAILQTLKSELYHIFSIVDKDESDRLRMSISIEYSSQNSHRKISHTHTPSSNASLSQIDFLNIESDNTDSQHTSPNNGYNHDHKHNHSIDDANDDDDDDDDYVVVSFT